VRKIQQLKAGKLPLINIDLCDIIEDIQRHYSRSGAKTVTINFERVPGCYVLANELLHDVFANLIGNAIKHSPDTYNLIIDITITELCEDSKNYYLVMVSDNGPGIPDKRKEKLFERFQYEEAPAKGTGLGLYLVKTLVEAFGGQVWVEDRVPGDYTKGTKFIVKLPATEVC
jgi:signal transduction histidine kinase